MNCNWIVFSALLTRTKNFKYELRNNPYMYITVINNYLFPSQIPDICLLILKAHTLCYLYGRTILRWTLLLSSTLIVVHSSTQNTYQFVACFYNHARHCTPELVFTVLFLGISRKKCFTRRLYDYHMWWMELTTGWMLEYLSSYSTLIIRNLQSDYHN